jgi:parvulin-like peptidyl-prolyl isomerase
MIVAKINDYEISGKEFDAELKRVMALMKLEQVTEEVRQRALEQLIDGFLLLSCAKDSDVKVAGDAVEEKLLDLMLNYESKEDFYKMLNEHNLSLETIKTKLHDEILTREFIRFSFSDCEEVSLLKLQEVYAENLDSFKTHSMVRASHIFIAEEGEEGLKKISDIRNSISGKEDFLKMAESSSDCPSNCKCGDLGYFSKGKMVKEFEEVAFNLEEGEVSQPVKTQFGYHLILVTDKKSGKTASFEEVKDALTKRLNQIDSELKLIKFLKKKRVEADIEIFI